LRLSVLRRSRSRSARFLKVESLDTVEQAYLAEPCTSIVVARVLCQSLLVRSDRGREVTPLDRSECLRVQRRQRSRLRFVGSLFGVRRLLLATDAACDAVLRGHLQQLVEYLTHLLFRH